MKKSVLTIVLMFAVLFCVAQGSSITVTSVNQRTDGSGLVDIFFNLIGPTSTYNISAQVSFNGGSTYVPIPSQFLSGNAKGITPGNSKYIVWDGLGSFPNTYSTMAKFKLTATVESTSGIPCPDMPTYTDPRDGKTYNTVQIGNQCWMKENLNYNSGSNTCYGDNSLNCRDYGRLYKWSATPTACPNGWHLPSDNEWSQLVDYAVLQGNPNTNTENGAGNALKSCRQVNSPLGGDCRTYIPPRWNEHDTHYGFDKFGFSATPGGCYAYYTYYYFTSLGNAGYWWSSSGRQWYINYDNGGVSNSSIPSYQSYYYLSIRCVRD